MAKCVFVVLALAVGGFMFREWFLLRRQQGRRQTTPQQLYRATVVTAWAATVAAVVLGNDQPQRVLSGLVTFGIGLAAVQGVADRRARQ